MGSGQELFFNCSLGAERVWDESFPIRFGTTPVHGNKIHNIQELRGALDPKPYLASPMHQKLHNIVSWSYCEPQS